MALNGLLNLYKAPSKFCSQWNKRKLRNDSKIVIGNKGDTSKEKWHETEEKKKEKRN